MKVLANQNSSAILFYTKQSLPCRSETVLSLSSGPTLRPYKEANLFLNNSITQLIQLRKFDA